MFRDGGITVRNTRRSQIASALSSVLAVGVVALRALGDPASATRSSSPRWMFDAGG